MKPLRAWEARSGKVVPVRVEDHPPPSDPSSPAPLYAVVEEAAGESPRFRGLVSARKAAAHPGRIFADLVGRKDPELFPADGCLEEALRKMEDEGISLLPLAGPNGLFAGALSRESALSALLERERQLREKTGRLQSLVEKKNRALEFKVKQLFHGLEAGKNLFQLLSNPSKDDAFYEKGIGALAALLRCRYGAIGLLDKAGAMEGFFVTGISAQTRQKIGPLPRGTGLLGVVIQEQRALRLEDMSRHPASKGFPPFHPDMKTLLAVPITGRERVLGRIYLCEKVSGEPFSEEDEKLAWSFASSLANLLDHLASLEEKARLQEQISQAQRMESLGRLAGGVAHDFNNFLTVILGNAIALQETIPPESSLGRKLESIRQAAEKASSLTRQLLSFGQRRVIPAVSMDLNASVRAVEELLRGSLGKKIKLTLELAPDLGPVRADPLQIDQVLLNLTLNARDAMPAGGEVSLRTENLELPERWECRYFQLPPGNWAVLSFQDNGKGMDAKTRERVFEPFFTTKERGKGSGLGLSAAHGIVKQFGGCMDVKSDQGYGTTFTIYLPHAEDAPENQPSLPVVGLGGELTRTVLVVDDDEQVLAAEEKLLQQAGWSVMKAASGSQALSLARDLGEGIDLFLLDLIMPEMDGKEVAEKILSLHPGARILFCSGYPGDSFDENDLRRLGGAFLPKPFSSRSFALKAREVLEKAAAGMRGAGLKALIIDDEPEVRKVLAGILQSLGFRILEAGDGNQGLRIVEREAPDLVFCDLVMPDKDGLEVCREIRKKAPGVKVLAMSGAANGPQYLKVASMLGSGHSLQKPLRKTEIVEAVHAVLGRG